MRNIFLILFLLLCFSINAQTKRSAEIVSFTIDTTVHYEIKYSGKELNFQIEEFNKEKWIIVSGSKESNESIFPVSDKDKGYVSKNEFKKLTSGKKYRLKITYPITLISTELEYKK